jgi:hypothetical protein
MLEDFSQTLGGYALPYSKRFNSIIIEFAIQLL